MRTQPVHAGSKLLVCAMILANALILGCGDDKGSDPAPPPQIPEGMVRIPPGEGSPGTFTMGSPVEEIGREVDEVAHEVTLTKAFYMLDHEVTRKEWRAALGLDPVHPSQANLPVADMTWLEAIAYCNAKSAAEGLEPAYTIQDEQVAWDQTRNGYRLPTEAEWEFACRAMTDGAFAGKSLDSLGWYGENSGNRLQEVRGKAPNAWGLHDMHGNLSEWCWDWSAAYPASAIDPTGAALSKSRVVRGGSYMVVAEACRSATRSAVSPDRGLFLVGLRTVRTAS